MEPTEGEWEGVVKTQETGEYVPPTAQQYQGETYVAGPPLQEGAVMVSSVPTAPSAMMAPPMAPSAVMAPSGAPMYYTQQPMVSPYYQTQPQMMGTMPMGMVAATSTMPMTMGTSTMPMGSTMMAMPPQRVGIQSSTNDDSIQFATYNPNLGKGATSMVSAQQPSRGGFHGQSAAPATHEVKVKYEDLPSCNRCGKKHNLGEGTRYWTCTGCGFHNDTRNSEYCACDECCVVL